MSESRMNKVEIEPNPLIIDDYGNPILRRNIGEFCHDKKNNFNFVVRIYKLRGDIGFDIQSNPEEEKKLFDTFMKTNDEESAGVLAGFILKSKKSRKAILANPELRAAIKQAVEANPQISKEYSAQGLTLIQML